jgi:hypothetical protein
LTLTAQTLTRLEFVETKAPLVLDEIDYTIGDRAFLASALAAPLEYAQRVESLVGHTDMGDLMPRRDARVDRFLATWTDDELTHARALANLMHRLELEPVDLDTFTPPAHNRWIPILGRASASLHRVVSMIWATSGSMNEHLALGAYSKIDSVLQERHERGLHETLFRRLRAHESAHKSFYTAYANELWAGMRPWQRRLTRYGMIKVWAPVGATDAADKPAFARTVAALSPDAWRQTMVDPLQAIAERLMEHDGQPLEPFVERAVLECLDADPVGRAIR